MAHAEQRAIERLAEIGFDADKAKQVFALAQRVADHFRTDEVACRLFRLNREIGDRTADVLTRQSNGDEVWAICRNGEVFTIMLRRSNQPATPEALRVRKVTALKAN